MTEREHERMLSELTAKHKEDLNQLRESMEAAHQVELQQAQVYFMSTCRHLEPGHAVKISLLSLPYSSLRYLFHSQSNFVFAITCTYLCFYFLQVQKTEELEAMRLSLTSIHVSQLEHSHVNLKQEQESALTKAQASLRETFAQESALLQTQHQLELDQIRQQNEEQQEKLRERHREEMGECCSVGVRVRVFALRYTQHSQQVCHYGCG